MKQKKLTGTQLAKQLGISRVTLYRLKRQYPAEAPKTFDNVEKWPSFALAHLVGSDQVTRLAR